MKSLVILLVMVFAAPCFGQWGYSSYGTVSPRVRYDSSYNPYSLSSRYSANPPKLYSGDGTYLGELSENKYRMDSVSNPYSRFGSRYSPDSINNPYSPYGRYRTQPIYIYQSSW